MSLGHPFTDNELLILLETARVALSDADIFDDMAFAHDIADADMLKLRDKLVEFMEEDKK